MGKEKPGGIRTGRSAHRAEESVMPKRTRIVTATLGGKGPGPAHGPKAHQAELGKQNQELRQANLELEESLRRYSDLYDSSPLGHFTFDREGRILGANLTGARLLGQERDRLLNRSFHTFVVAAERPVFKAFCRRVLESGTRQTCEVKLLRPWKSIIHAQIEGIVREGTRRKAKGCHAAIIDITEHKQKEDVLRRAHSEVERRIQEQNAELRKLSKALRMENDGRRRAEGAAGESEERYRILVETMNDGLVAQDKDSVITYVNDRFCEMVGSSREKIIGHLVTDFLDEAYRKIYKEQMTGRKRGEHRSYELSWLKKNGQRCFAVLSPRAVFDSGGQMKGSFAVVTDITERKQTEEALQESEKRLRYLSAQLLNAQERERRRIARELHDGIGQTLSAAKFSLERKLSQMGPGTPPPGISLEDIIPILKDGIDEVRRISTDLWPSMLDDLGILATLSWSCRQFQTIHPDIRIEKEVTVREEEVPQPLKVVMFRVLQEAMNNVSKYSKTSVVQVSLKKVRDEIHLTIRDRGQGFDLEHSRRGLGLASMKERTELSGGSFAIHSTPGKGTMVQATWKVPGEVES